MPIKSGSRMQEVCNKLVSNRLWEVFGVEPSGLGIGYW
jgi:hypothetical protein